MSQFWGLGRVRFSRKANEGPVRFLGSAPGPNLEPCWVPKTRPREAEIWKKRDFWTFLEGMQKERGFGDDFGTIIGALGKAKTSKSVGGFARNQFSAFAR